jgi:hypothetical protein
MSQRRNDNNEWKRFLSRFTFPNSNSINALFDQEGKKIIFINNESINDNITAEEVQAR